MKFLFDVGVGALAEQGLQARGYDVLAVRDLDPAMPDEEILLRAEIEGRMVVTMDKDFGELVYHSARIHAGVLLLRMEAATGEEKQQVVVDIVERYADAIAGKFAVYQRGKLRIR